MDEVCPPISSYYITSGDKTISVPNNINDTYMYTISGIGKGTHVTITVFAENTIGNGTKHYEVICKLSLATKHVHVLLVL